MPSNPPPSSPAPLLPTPGSTEFLGGEQFSERDMEVLRLIGEEDLLGFTFEGLRRKLGAHSETLSRVLHRLEEQMILERTSGGYRVTEKGRATMGLGVRQLSTPGHKITILRTLLPHVKSGLDAVMGLRGRWFGPLRWLGYSEDESGTTLKWITEDGAIQIDALFSEGELSIEGRIREGRDLTDAIRASYQLVGYLSRVYSPRVAGRVALYALGNGAFSMPN